MMKIYRVLPLLLCAALLFTGCVSAPTNQDTTGTTGPNTTVTDTTGPNGTQTTVPEPTEDTQIFQKPMASVSMPIHTATSKAQDGTVIFKYTTQGMSMILQDPDVASSVIKDFEDRIQATSSAAGSLLDQAKKEYSADSNWTPYQFQIMYSPTRLDHGIMSIYGSQFAYAGAGRPEAVHLAANYDLVTGNVLYLPDIFANDGWVQSITTLVLDTLEDCKTQYELYDHYETTVTAYFNGNLSQNENWYFTDTGLCFFFDLYKIAPYSAGVVTVEIPYEKLTSILNSAYFPAELEPANGSITVKDFASVDLAGFTQISELILDADGKMLLLYTDTYVQNITITVSNITAGLMETDVYACYTLTPGDAVMVQLPKSTEKVTLYYTSGGRFMSQTLTAD